MTAATLDLTGDSIIEQGSYWSLMIKYPGNVETAQIRGQIKENFGGKILASFHFQEPFFDEDINKTVFLGYLFAAETRKIPVPAQHHVYDWLMYLENQDPFRLLRGNVFVSPGVTDG